jgi:mRNA-degrading endonuclease RelE of RelBE toxin-antitoxin system
MFKAEYHPAIKKDLKKIDPQIREKIRYEHIPKILLNPDVGEKLSGDLKGTFSYHFKVAGQQFRVAYIKDDKKQTVFIQMIARRGDFYSYLKRRI